MASHDTPHGKLTAEASGIELARGEAVSRVLRQFRVVFNAVKTHFQQVEKQAGIGGAQVWALSVIQARPGIGVNELARAMDVRQPTASNLVRSLAVSNLIEARRNDLDRRAVHLHLRAPGLQVLRRTPGPFEGVLPQSLGRLDARTLRRLEQDLAALIAELEVDDGAAEAPLGAL